MPTEAIVKRPTHFEYDDFNLASNFELCVLMATLTENDLFGSSSEEDGDEGYIEDDYLDKVEESDSNNDNTSLLQYIETFLPKVDSSPKRANVNYQSANPDRPKFFDTPFQSKGNLVYISEKVTFKNGMHGVGGGRGFVANARIAPGTLLLAEKSFLRISAGTKEKDWTKETGLTGTSNLSAKTQRPAVQLLKQIFCNENKQPQDIAFILKELRHLHPISYVDIEKSHASELLKEYQEDIEYLKKCVDKKIASKFQLDEEFYVLHICKIHFNAFPTGIYLNFAMTNHSCKPNSIKWVEGSHGNGNHSELRACEEISEGEEITIGYISKRELLYEERQDYLYKQFRFKCACFLCNATKLKDGKMNDLCIKLEPTFGGSKKAESGGSGHKKLVNDFVGFLNFWENEKLYKVTLDILVKIAQERDAYIKSKIDTYYEVTDRANRMNARQVVEGDILVSRANKLLADKCENILVQQNLEIGSTNHMKILQILLLSLLMLRESELIYISTGPHVEAAETLSRIAKVLQQFLGLGIQGSKFLLNNIYFWGTRGEEEKRCIFNKMSEVSKFMRECERVCKRIKDLYS